MTSIQLDDARLILYLDRVGYGMSFWSTGRGFDLSWRLSILVQFIPALIFCVGLPFCPER
jgi:hypothetical protein